MASVASPHPSLLIDSLCNSLENNVFLAKHHVVGIKELVDGGIHQVPKEYIRVPEQRPFFSQVCCTEEVPIVDLAELLGTGRSKVVAEIGRACKEWGLFQVVNHGVGQGVIDNMWAAVRKFFDQPVEERMKYYSEDIQSPVAYHTSFVRSKEQVKEWRDALKFRSIPGQSEDLKQAPPFCREPVLEYLSEIRALAKAVYEAIFESLGVHADSIEKLALYFQQTLMAANYYPPCPDPNLTLGLSGHTDAGSLTVLLQDEVSGLQVYKADRWVQVKPMTGSFVVNVADQIEILTNGEYRGAIHRAVTNSEKPRMSIACVFMPCEEARVGPLPELIDSSNPPVYRETRFGDYLKFFYSKTLSQSTIESVKSSTSSSSSRALFPSRFESKTELTFHPT